MSVSMLLVSGFDVMLVGRFEFGSVVGYSIAASFIPIISGLLYAVLNAMMPHAAGLHARGDGRQLGDLVISCTRLCVLLLVVIGAPAIIYSTPLLQLWLGPAFTPQARLILIVLLLANMIRLAGAAYSIILVAAAQQRLIKISPLAEGVSNLLASLVLGVLLGAIGVALGTVIGAIVSMAAHFFYNMPRTAGEISFSRQELLWAGMVVPAFCTSPLLIAAGCSSMGMRVTPGCFLLVMVWSLIAGGHLLFRSSGRPRLAKLRERFL
jgi:O-antigen/teichoic acid export membrane protein